MNSRDLFGAVTSRGAEGRPAVLFMSGLSFLKGQTFKQQGDF